MMARMNAPASKSESSAPAHGGKIVVLGIFFVALIAAAAGLVYKYFASRQPLEMWGPAGIQVIQSAPKVELLTVRTYPGPPGETLSFGEQPLYVRAVQDISKAQGLIHHRHFLTEYVSYADRPLAAKERRDWQYAVRFRYEKRDPQVVVLFDLKNSRLGNLQTGQEVQVIDKIAENWQRFIERQLAEKPEEAKE
jgi:hypothetical protein